jgi:lysophospholipase L1-like esterase
MGGWVAEIIHALATMLLGPLLLLQGLRVRAVTPILPEAEGERMGTLGKGAPLRLLVLGDSSAAGVGAETQSQALLGQLTQRLAGFHEVTFRLEANTGATTLDAIGTVSEIQGEEHYDAVVMALGVNDVTSRRTKRRWLRDQACLIDLVSTKFGSPLILISGLPPMHEFPALPQPLRWYLGERAKDFDRALMTLSGSCGAIFIPLDFAADSGGMAADGFHPGPPVYLQWAKRAAEKIMAGAATRSTVPHIIRQR